jgi:predicted GNAT family N-acyltransferase
MLIEGKILNNGYDLSEVYSIRRTVFVEEYELTEQEEFDGQDDMAMHVIVYEETGGKKAVATGRIIFDGATCEVGHIAVLKEYRNKRYGDFTVRMLLNKAFTAGIQDVETISYIENADFFRKIGFQQMDSEIIYQNRRCCKMKINQKDIIIPCHKMT